MDRYLFNGIERQPETGIYQARFRGLDPAIGRWMQIDPKPDQSMSLYEFGKSIDLIKILPNIMKDNKNAAKMMGALGFANAVRPGGKWDYKDANAQKGNIFGAVAKYDKSNDKTTAFTSGNMNFVEGGADVGNYNYGYTGRYVGDDGYNPITLWGAAGVLQTGKDIIKRNWGKAISEFGSMAPSAQPPFGDETDDFIWTTTGMIHADNEKKGN